MYGREVHIDTPLSNFAVKAFQGMDGFIAPLVFPQVPVAKQSDVYYIIEKAAWLRVPNTLRAPKTRANRVEFTVTSATFFCHNHALAGDNALEDLSNADVAVQLRENTTANVLEALNRAREVRVANMITSVSNMGSGVALAGAAKWSDYASSAPIADVTTAHAFIRNNTGLQANTAIIDYDTLMILRQHPDLLDMYKYTAGGSITDEQIKAAFRVQNLLIGNGIKNNALEGATASITNIWGNVCILARLVPGVSLQTATLGVQMRWRPDGIPSDMQVYRSIENAAGSRKIEILETGYFGDEKIVAKELGYVIKDTL